MSANSAELSSRLAAPAGGLSRAGDGPPPAEPLYFPSGKHQLFGWLHPPCGEGLSEWGVVLCNAFGYEAHCGHRSARAFAGAISLLGIPTLRFDYLGTGDSPDIDPGADQIETWSMDIVHAVAELRRRTGIERVCLLGFRLGALLATLAAPRCEVETLALVAPVLSGRRYLKEARTLQLAADAAEAAASGAPAQGRGADTASGAGVIEISGHPLSAASITTLKQLEVTAGQLSGITSALVIDRADLPSAREWVQELARAQIQVDYQVLPGFVEMMMVPPHLAAVPRQMIEAMRQWLSGIATTSPVSRPARRSVAGQTELAAASRQLVLRAEDDFGASALIERPLFLDADRMVFGIVTEPRRDERRRRAVIIPNSGAEYHVGVSLMSVSLAREWARRGYYVLRMDLSGLGDSRTRPGCRDDEVFPADALTDIAAAIENMNSRYGIREFTLVGFCSGGYHSLRCAVAGLPVSRLLMVNVQDFHRGQNIKAGVLQLAEVVRNPALYRERVFSMTTWKRLLTGRLNVWNVVRVYLGFLLLPLTSRARDLARSLGLLMRNDLGRELQEIVERGVRVVFIYSRGEPGINLLTVEAGAMLKRLGDRCRMRIIDGADHVFSRSRPRSRLRQVLSEELFERTEIDQKPSTRASTPG